MQLKPNQLIDNRYKIISKLGQGGMGAVWKATDTKLGDEVVLKLPLAVHDEQILKRFGQEALTMRKYSGHCPFILDIQDVGDIDGVPFYVMRYQAGGALRDRIDASGAGDGATNQHWTLKSFGWLPKIAEALDFLHTKKCFHRDVKPENILFSSEGAPFLVDFGIVKELGTNNTVLTATGMSIGTCAYMAPEVLREAPYSAQADQYALAVTVYEAITGERPYAGSNLFALYDAFRAGHRKLTDLSGQIPPAASLAVDRALSGEPEQRFKTCGDFSKEFLVGLSKPISIKPPPPEIVEMETNSDDAEEATRKLDLKKHKQDLAYNRPEGESTEQTKSGNLRRIAGWLSAVAVVSGICYATLGGSDPTGTDVMKTISVPQTLAHLTRKTVTRVENVPATPQPATNYSEPVWLDVDPSVKLDSKPPIPSPAAPPEIEITNSIGMQFQLISSGSFMMGRAADELGLGDDELRHEVVISKDFYLGTTEVTQGQWKSVMGTEPWKGKDYVKEGDTIAASYISWADAFVFCEKLGARDGAKYRLPREAEWEYACRSGSDDVYSFGSDLEELEKYAWFDTNAASIGQDYAHVAGQKLSNKFGLHDMHGNVREWCSDWYARDYYAKSPLEDPKGPAVGSFRSVRGGSWDITMLHCRSAFRDRSMPDSQISGLGFRVLCSSFK